MKPKPVLTLFLSLVVIFVFFTYSKDADAFFGIFEKEIEWVKIYSSEKRSLEYIGEVKREGNIVSFYKLEDLFSPMQVSGKLAKSMIYYISGSCEKYNFKVTAMEFFTGQMGAGEAFLSDDDINIIGREFLVPDGQNWLKITCP